MREVDTITKLIEYHEAMVPMYVIIDRVKEDDWPTIRGYRYAPEGYESLTLDDRDCLLLPALGLRLCANQNRIALYDAQTGEELGDYIAISEALEAEIAARQAAEAQARQAREQARLAQEQVRVAQDRIRAEAEARQKAQEQARAEAEARQKAEAVQMELERRLRELEQRLQQSPGS